MENTHRLQLEAKRQAELIPYRNDQHQALKTYFSELGSMALALKNDPKLAERFNAAASQSDLAQVCSRVFIPKSEWQAVMARCTRNRFFLCAEEVRAYPSIVLGFKGSLKPDLQRRFGQTDSCRSAMFD